VHPGRQWHAQTTERTMQEPDFWPATWDGARLAAPLRQPGSSRASRRAAYQARRNAATAAALADLPVESKRKDVHLRYVLLGVLLLVGGCVLLVRASRCPSLPGCVLTAPLIVAWSLWPEEQSARRLVSRATASKTRET
jgi:hypothetical protein